MPDLDKLLSAIDAAEEYAYGGTSESELADERDLAIRLYLGKDVDPAPPGRSSVVDRTTFETVQWILPSLCRIFASGEDIVEFIPQGPEDEAAAKQEGEYLNYLVTQRNKWFELCNEWFTDALLTKNAYCWAYIDKTRHVEIERYERQTQEGLALLMQGEGVELVGANPSDETGELYDIELRRTKERRQLAFQVLPPERVKVSHNTPSFSLRGCDYFEYWDYKTISALRAEGYDVEDDIPDDVEGDALEDDARDQYNENTAASIDLQGVSSPEMRRVRVRCVWIRHDYDEDGIAELQYVLRVGRKVLYREECSRIPVSSIVPNPLPHRHIGLSVADLTGDIQRIKSAILRQALDNLYFANNPAIAFDKNTVNLDDVLTSRPGQRICVDGPPGASFLPVTTPFVFPAAIDALGFMEQITEGRTGVNRYFQGSDQNTLNKTASGIQQLSTMAAQRVEQIARIFASGIEELFSIAHELVLKTGHQKEVVRLRGQWVSVDPSAWKTRNDMRISVGFAAGNKDAMVSRLMMIAQLQEKAMAGGLPIVNAQNLYQTALEITKAADFSAPQRFWTDPSQMPPRQPPQPDVTVTAAEQIRAQSLLQKAQLDNQTRLQIAAMDQRTEVVKIDGAAASEDRRISNNPKVIEAKTQEMETKAMADFIGTLMQSQTQQTETILRALQELSQAVRVVGAPREALRDGTGRIVGSRPVVSE
jgi:hypothetical protein